MELYCCCSVTKLCSTICNHVDWSTPVFPVHHQLPELAQTHVHRVGDAIEPSSAIPFSSYLQSFLASGSFPVSQFFAPGGQSIGASVQPQSFQRTPRTDLPVGWTGWIFFQSKGLSRVFSNPTVQKHQFFDTQLSLWSNSPIRTWLLENHMFDYTDLCQQSNVSAF